MKGELQELERRREEIRTRLSMIGDMRQGSLSERYRKCGKPSCRCASDDSFAHGPCFSLTRGVKGKTLTRVIPARAVEETRSQLARGQEFRRTSQELYEVNEKICETKLTGSVVSATDDSKKKNLKQISKLKSRRRSKN